MPYINIKITREGATAEQKAELIKGATELLARVLNKNPKTTVVTIEEVDTDSWGIGGDPVEIARENEKLRVAEIEKLKVDKDALERKLAEVKDILLTFPDDEPPVFTLDNNALKLKKGKKSKGSTKNKTDCRCKAFLFMETTAVSFALNQRLISFCFP